MWDPHTPYRTPESFGDPFRRDALSAAGSTRKCGRITGASRDHIPPRRSRVSVPTRAGRAFPANPWWPTTWRRCDRMFDGYDTGVRYVDHHIDVILERLAALGIEDEVAVIISADHGETLGELGIYCDHQTADHHVARVPMIIRWPGLAGGVDDSLHYQVDVAATLLELSGGSVPTRWDGQSFQVLACLTGLRGQGLPRLDARGMDRTAGRSFRRLDLHPDVPRQLPRVPRHHAVRPQDGSARSSTTCRKSRPDIVRDRRTISWRIGRQSAVADSPTGVDPLDTVLEEGDPWHARWRPAEYDAWLEETGRATWVSRVADRLNRLPPPVDLRLLLHQLDQRAERGLRDARTPPSSLASPGAAPRR